MPSASGFIHASGVVYAMGKPCYILQKFNTTIFEDTEAIYHNFQQASAYLIDPLYKHFDWILTNSQSPFYQDTEGCIWRLLSFVQESTELKQIRTEQETYSCGRLLGLFHKQVAAGDATSLKVIIPDFQNIPKRWKELESALETGLPERIEKIRSELVQLKDLKKYVLVEPKEIPNRICHNDTKLSNLLFHEKTHEALCFVDLDTLMPGHLYHDFGDLARCVIAPFSEDTQHVYEQELNTTFFTSLLEGIKSSGFKIQKEEVLSLTYGLISMPFLHGVRALTDYILGDLYYKVSHPEQNLYRALNLLGVARECFLRKEELDREIKMTLGSSI